MPASSGLASIQSATATMVLPLPSGGRRASTLAAHALGDVLLRRKEDADARAHRPRRPRRRDLAALRSWRPLARAEALLQLRHRRLVLHQLGPAVDEQHAPTIDDSHRAARLAGQGPALGG